MSSSRLMTTAEREKWRIRDDQCPVVLTVRLPDDSACLLPIPCAKHARLATKPYGGHCSQQLQCPGACQCGLDVREEQGPGATK